MVSNAHNDWVPRTLVGYAGTALEWQPFAGEWRNPDEKGPPGSIRFGVPLTAPKPAHVILAL